jgi:hypothetical protein
VSLDGDERTASALPAGIHRMQNNNKLLPIKRSERAVLLAVAQLDPRATIRKIEAIVHVNEDEKYKKNTCLKALQELQRLKYIRVSGSEIDGAGPPSRTYAITFDGILVLGNLPIPNSRTRKLGPPSEGPEPPRNRP